MTRLYMHIFLYLLYATYVLSNGLSAVNVLLLLVIIVTYLSLELIQNILLKYLIIVCYSIFCWFNPLGYLGLTLLIASGVHPLYYLLMALPAVFKLDLTALITILAFGSVQWLQLHTSLQFKAQRQLRIQYENQLTSIQKQNEIEHTQMLLRQKQDIEISVLNERNRIARDIHDNVGHLLTRALLQVGALQATSDNHQYDSLKETLDQGMNAIRSSVHELYEHSEHLEHEIDKLLLNFPKLSFSFSCHLVQEPKASIRALFLSVIREALTNTIKHSNGNHVTLKIDESSQHYYCIINDNGSYTPSSLPKGMGLLSLEKRIKEENGIINIQPEQGYRIYISIPKEDI